MRGRCQYASLLNSIYGKPIDLCRVKSALQPLRLSFFAYLTYSQSRSRGGKIVLGRASTSAVRVVSPHFLTINTVLRNLSRLYRFWYVGERSRIIAQVTVIIKQR